MRELRYRTESYLGLREYDAVEVMAFETYELENTDILYTLRSTILKDHPIAKQMEELEKEMEKEGFVDDMGLDDWEKFYKNVLDIIEQLTGYKVKYVLWLADLDAVREYYGQYMYDENDYDAYPIGPVVLSDLGDQGALYGYTTFPKEVPEKMIYARN